MNVDDIFGNLNADAVNLGVVSECVPRLGLVEQCYLPLPVSTTDRLGKHGVCKVELV